MILLRIINRSEKYLRDPSIPNQQDRLSFFKILDLLGFYEDVGTN
ncbi:hypothetical protein [Leptospira noguchii]|nr:hypothetical protein [Leptospira noguchii]